MPEAGNPIPSDTGNPAPPHDLATMAAISIVAFALATLLHEGPGHGGACLLVGCKPTILTSMNFDGDTSGVSDGANRFIATNGTIVNLIVGTLAFATLRAYRIPQPTLHYFLWLFATVNLMVGTGYFLFSGVSGIGDWAGVTGGWQPALLWRILLSVGGLLSYYAVIYTALYALGPFIGGDPETRLRQANRLMLVPYITGSLLSIIAGLFNPGGIGLVLVSGAAASLGGTSGLAWGAQLLHGPAVRPYTGPRVILARHAGWLVAGVVVALVFVFVFGPGIHFPKG